MKAMEIKASYRRARRPLPQLKSSHEIATYARKYYGGQLELQEMVLAIPFDAKLTALGVIEVSKGSLTSTQCDPKIVFSRVLVANAVAFALVHNHPSGRATPSQADNNLTKVIKKGADILDLNMIDHVIVTRDDYYSYADNSLI